MLFEDVVFVDKLLPNDDLRGTVLQDLECDGNSLSRSEGPMSAYLTDSLLVTAIRKLEIVAGCSISLDLESMRSCIPSSNMLILDVNQRIGRY